MFGVLLREYLGAGRGRGCEVGDGEQSFATEARGVVEAMELLLLWLGASTAPAAGCGAVS